jgi:hypothetical protein
MWDADMFGVQDPESGENGYCCVMGRLGEHFALGVYNGSEGLAGLWKMRMTESVTSHDPVEVLSWQDCLMASYEDRSQLKKLDLDLIKELGLKFRGRNQWPLFRSYRPGYAPWFLTAAEARFLTVCLQQALDVVARFRDDRGLIGEPGPQGPYLVRVPEKPGEEWVWKDTYQKPAPARRSESPPVPPLDEARLERLRRLPASRGVLEMDYFFTSATIKGEEDERPWYPQLVIGADGDTGMILGFELVPAAEAPAALVEQLLQILERMESRPSRVMVQRDEARDVLRPVTDRLRIRLMRGRRLPAVDMARSELGSFLALGGP